MNFHAQIADSAQEAARVAAGVGADRLGLPTPCVGYDTHALVNHLVAYTGIGMELRARREPHPDDLATRDFTADPQWARQYAEQLDRSVAAWADPAVWEGEISGMPVEGMAGMLFIELCLHGWDLARATGQDYRIADATAERLLAAVREFAPMFREHKGFAEPVETRADAAPLEAAVALSGRNPCWPE